MVGILFEIVPMQELAVPCNAVSNSSLSRVGLENKACQRLDALLGRHLLYRTVFVFLIKGLRTYSRDDVQT